MTFHTPGAGTPGCSRPAAVCNTLRAGTKAPGGPFTSPRPIHPHLARVITVREAARLHSYPDWFRFHATKWHGFRQIGNSVPPLLARAVASQWIKAMGLAPSKPTVALTMGSEAALNFTMADAVRRYGLAASPIAGRIRTAADVRDATDQPQFEFDGVASDV